MYTRWPNLYTPGLSASNGPQMDRVLCSKLNYRLSQQFRGTRVHTQWMAVVCKHFTRRSGGHYTRCTVSRSPKFASQNIIACESSRIRDVNKHTPVLGAPNWLRRWANYRTHSFTGLRIRLRDEISAWKPETRFISTIHSTHTIYILRTYTYACNIFEGISIKTKNFKKKSLIYNVN